MALPRPRDRKSKAWGTWTGKGRHGKGKGEEWRLETAEEMQNDVDQLDESAESLAPVDGLVGDEEVDQEVGVLQPEGLHPLQRRRRPA